MSHLHASMPEVMHLLAALKVDITRPVSKVILDITAAEWVTIDITYEIRDHEAMLMAHDVGKVTERYRLEKLDDTRSESQSQDTSVVQG